MLFLEIDKLESFGGHVLFSEMETIYRDGKHKNNNIEIMLFILMEEIELTCGHIE